MIPARRATKRIANRLSKNGLTFIRYEHGDNHLVTMRVVLETKRDHIGRVFTYPMQWLKTAPPRVIADAVLWDYAKGYGHRPA